ncbi:MAG: hypothetical protein CO142_01765 [Candidatus Moranbacteria bacterium CG_4_9_14_3_um_filter_44_28]|uniref:Histidine kinase N-terminal 7TM region domain-containing protein n=2 Tax=Candidatus Nealsoniibacteriota TaxID=1817911 RepID=A0A2G9YZI3_9BACT|nr:MAG: hypothetical protein COX35_02460 [Candidatus Nealsonbacteria bacterium CG23_combo_of_CG06-09_8_20_14_all_37_18]PJA86138.1 MAG: hypothetical protein CO142_01765 [Candidatus Moranbacteria bacterium CG_4_9_14_3_um_filter_44_28]
MFFGSSSIDLQIIILLLGISVIASLVVFAVAKRKFLAVPIFSILVNAIFFLAVLTGSEIFRAYRIIWFGYFSFFIWPLLNIFLIIHYARTNPKK